MCVSVCVRTYIHTYTYTPIHTYIFETRFSHVALTFWEFHYVDHMVLNSQRSTSLCLLSTGIKGVHHYSQLIWFVVGSLFCFVFLSSKLSWEYSAVAECKTLSSIPNMPTPPEKHTHGHPQLRSQFEANLGYMCPPLPCI